MAFQVGQKVVCVDDRWSRSRYRPTDPKRGAVYTVRAIAPCKDHGHNEDGLHLVEIVNKPRSHRCPDGRRRKCEAAYRMSHFRPLRMTSIDIFTRMLEPAPRETAEPVKA
jgi:hypothetical protein